MSESPNEEDTYQHFIQNNFEYKAELINFLNSISTSWNEPNSPPQETGLDPNIASYSGISNYSIINPKQIYQVGRGVDTFEPSLQAQVEGNAQVSNFTPMVHEDSQNQGSNQPLNVPNSSLNTNVQTPNQASTQSERNEDSTNQDSNQTKKVRTDELKWQMYISPMICLKALFKEKFVSNIESYDCKDHMGTKYNERQNFLNTSVKELLNKHGETKDKIDKKLESCDETTKKEINYYLNMTYKQLSEHYEEIKANLQMLKGTFLTINKLISRENEIQSKRERREKYRINKKNGNNNVLHELRIGNFEKGLEALFENIEKGKWQRGEKGQEEKIKIFKIKKIKRKKKRKRRGET